MVMGHRGLVVRTLVCIDPSCRHGNGAQGCSGQNTCVNIDPVVLVMMRSGLVVKTLVCRLILLSWYWGAVV